MNKLKQYIDENYKMAEIQMNLRHDYLMELQSYNDKHGYIPNSSNKNKINEHVQSWEIWKQEGFKKWSNIPGVKRKMYRAAKVSALLWIELDLENQKSLCVGTGYSNNHILECPECKSDNIKTVNSKRIIKKEISWRFRMVCESCEKSSRFYSDHDELVKDFSAVKQMFDMTAMEIRVSYGV